LCEVAKKIRFSGFSFFDANGEFEPQILVGKSLLLNGLVIVPVTFLHTEINPTRRPLDDYAKSYLSFHGHAAYISSYAYVTFDPVTKITSRLCSCWTSLSTWSGESFLGNSEVMVFLSFTTVLGFAFCRWVRFVATFS